MEDMDFFRWEWLPHARHIGDPYHCKTRQAIVIDGWLHDTFWLGHGSKFIQGGWGPSSHGGSRLNSDLIQLTFVANLNDLEQIPPGEEKFYKPSDILDLRHSNNNLAPIYKRQDATRSADVMRDLVKTLRRNARSELEAASRAINRAAELDAMIDAGKLDDIYL